MSNGTVRVGLIGAGRNTRDRHIPGFQKIQEVEIVAVANRSRESGQRVSEQFGIPQVYDNWQALLEDDSIDAVCIGTWPYMHAPMTVAALANDKHVLCEARMALNAGQAHDMLDAARLAPRCVAQIVPAPHTLEFDATIMDMIGAGYIGDLITVDARIAVASSFPNPSSPITWRQDRDMSGNNIMSMGIWYEAMMRWVGPMANVFATGQAVVSHRSNDAGQRQAMTIPDHVDIVGQMEQGGQIRFNVSTVLGHVPAGVDVCIFGTDGTLRLYQGGSDPMTLFAGQRGEDGLAPVDINADKRGGWRVEEEFINAIRGVEEVTHTDLTTAVKYMEWTDAVTQSLRTGQVVALPLMG